MKFLTKRNLLAGAAALVIAGGSAVAYETSTASAQAAPTPTARAGRGDFLKALAAKLGISTDQLQSSMDSVRKDLGLPEHGAGGFGMMGGRGGMFGPGAGMDALAKILGITTDQLRQEMPGKSITDLAKAHNVDIAKVKADLIAAATTRIDQAVTDGKLTADRAKTMKDNLATRIDTMVTRTMPTPGQGRMGRGDGDDHGGKGGGRDGMRGQGMGPQGNGGGRGPGGNQGQGAAPGQSGMNPGQGMGPLRRNGAVTPTPTVPAKSASDDGTNTNA
ncbi:MAG: hypothetical protein ACKO2D_14175 [Chloroflexota bacterium]|jgi:hypothetical protein